MAAKQPASYHFDWPPDTVIAAMDHREQDRLRWQARTAFDKRLIGDEEFERILLATGPASDRELAHLIRECDRVCAHLKSLRWIILAGFYALLFLLTVFSSLFH